MTSAITVPREPTLEMQDVWNACMERDETLLTTWAALLHAAGATQPHPLDAKLFTKLAERGRAMRGA